MARQRQSAQEWRASGESCARYAARFGWAPTTLRWWASTGLLRRGVTPAPPVPFIEVPPRTAHTPTSADRLDVVLRNGRRIRIRGDVSLDRIERLVAALERD
jgi:hypothetical protein